jgi:chemotaxis signal transduction protein
MYLASTTATTRLQNPESDTIEFFDDDAPRERVLVVEAAGHRLALPVSGVREVHRTVRVTQVPGAPPVMHGIANVRGAVVTVLDLAVALEAPFSRTEEWPVARQLPAATSRSGESSGSIVLLEHGTEVIGLRVDAVREVPARDDAPLAPPAVAAQLESSASTHAPLAGVVRVEGQDIALLDVAALFSRYLHTTE